MNKDLKTLNVEGKIVKEKGVCKVILTKEIIDRDGEIISVDGLDLTKYEANPIVLWGHRMANGDVEDVMGKAINLSKTKDADGVKMCTADIQFADHPKAVYLKGMVEKGIITSLSIGFGVKDGGYDFETKTIKNSELFELSFVTVPANPEARVLNAVKSLKLGNEDEMELFKKLNLLEEVHAKIKQYRKSFMSDEFCKFLGYVKTGDEVTDIQNIVAKIEELPEKKEEVVVEEKQDAKEEAKTEEVSKVEEAVDPKVTENQIPLETQGGITVEEAKEVFEDLLAKLD